MMAHLSAKAGGGAEVEDVEMPAIGAKEEGTSAALILVFLASGKLTVWSFVFH